ncbi:MAG: hypothetical protein U9N62_12685 [Thermotogota bacterium]|nr:hypothetical protein [Thermotogota bacterium]
MFRRIGQIFKDITETIKRERGKFQINSDLIGFKLKIQSFSSANEDIDIKDLQTLRHMFTPIDIQDKIPELVVKGESEYAYSPGVSSATIDFRVDLKRLTEHSLNKSIKSCSCEFEEILSFKELEINRFLETKLKETDVVNEEMNELQLNETNEIEDFQLSIQEEVFLNHRANVNSCQMKTEVIVDDLETEFDQKQKAAFHFENSTIFNAFVESYSPAINVNCNHSLRCVMRFPIKRYRVSKSGYERDELKRALSFIVKRYKSAGQLSIVGIYKNVPVDTAERLTFTKNGELFFYLKKGNRKRSVLLDVLVVKTKEGKYHVGPIIRKA